MKLLFVVALALFLSSVALAMPDSDQIGTYAVTFDMNTDLQYQKEIVQPIETESAAIYQMRIFTDNSTAAGISIFENKDWTDSTLLMHKNLMALQMALRGLNVTSVDDMTIDGKQGFVATSVPMSAAQGIPADAKLYSAMFWLDSKECGDCGVVSAGKTYVVVSSSYPQDVTQNLLSSLHLEMGQAAAAASTTQDMPPAQNQ
jgi:hypothetical protein